MLSRRDFVRGTAATLAAGTAGTVVTGCGGESADSGLTPFDFLAILDPEGTGYLELSMTIENVKYRI